VLSTFPNDYDPLAGLRRAAYPFHVNRDFGDEAPSITGAELIRRMTAAQSEPEGIDTNERGGMQSKLAVRYDLLDGRAMDRLAAVLAYGAKKYAPDNWRLIDVDAHLNHAMKHIMNYLDLRACRVVQSADDELGHAFCRLFMAVAVDAQGGPSADTTLGGLAH
jgi:hypothetical protein